MSSDGMPIGSIIMWGGIGVPTTSWRVCDGSEIPRKDHDDLVKAIGNLWGTPLDPEKIRLPDMRGVFPRGVCADGDVTRDPDRADRFDIVTGEPVTTPRPGTLQYGAVQRHHHKFQVNRDGYDSKHKHMAPNELTGHLEEDSTQYHGGHETRPINVYVHFIIKVK